MGYRIKRLQDMARAIRASKELVARERWPRERLERFQQERFEDLTRYAAAHSRFWRERLPADRPVKLADLPVLSKQELMERFDDLVTDPRLRLDDLLLHLEEIDDDALYLGEHRVMTSSGSPAARRSSSTTESPGRASGRCSCAAASGRTRDRGSRA